MSFEDDDDAPEGINEKVTISKDPFEIRKQELRDEQETIHENPDEPYVDIKLPTKGKVGENCVIKFSKKVPKAQVAISQNLQWKKRDKYDRQSNPELVARAFIIKEFKDVDKIEILWADIGFLHGKEINLLKAGEYFVEARAWSTGGGEETNSKRLITITKDE